MIRGGGRQSFSHAEGDAQNVLDSFHHIEGGSTLPVVNDQSLTVKDRQQEAERHSRYFTLLSIYKVQSIVSYIK